MIAPHSPGLVYLISPSTNLNKLLTRVLACSGYCHKRYLRNSGNRGLPTDFKIVQGKLLIYYCSCNLSVVEFFQCKVQINLWVLLIRHARLGPHWTFPHPDLTFYYNTLSIHIWNGGDQCHSKTRPGCVQGKAQLTASSARQSTGLVTQWEFATFTFFPLCHLPHSDQSISKFYSMQLICNVLNLEDWLMRGRGQMFFLITFTGSVSSKFTRCSFCRCSCITQTNREKEQQATSVGRRRNSVPLQLSTPTTEQAGPPYFMIILGGDDIVSDKQAPWKSVVNFSPAAPSRLQPSEQQLHVSGVEL